MGSKVWLRENLQEPPKKHRKINGLLLKMAIEIVDFPIKKMGGSVHSILYVYQRVSGSSGVFPLFFGRKCLWFNLNPFSIFWKLSLTQMLHGAGICTPIFTPFLWRSFVGVHIPAPWFASGWVWTDWSHEHITPFSITVTSWRLTNSISPTRSSSLGSVVHNHGISHCLVGYPHLWI